MNLNTQLSKTEQISGWCSEQKRMALAGIVLASHPAVSVEIGVWCGKSFMPIALAHKFIGSGKVIGVDPWRDVESVQGQITKADRDWWGDQSKHDWAFQQFSRHLTEFDVKHWVDIRRISSAEFKPTGSIGLFHCDGNHGDRALSDVMNISPHVISGGYVVLDDLNWSGGAVSRAVKWIEDMGFRRLYIVDDSETENRWGVWQRK